MEPQNILVVLNRDETSWQPTDPIIERAVELGDRFGAALTLLHTAYDHTLGFGVFASRDEIDAGRLQLMAAARERQQALRDRISTATGLAVSSATVWSHDRSRSILDAADDQQADLILKQSGEHAYLLGLLSNTDWDLVRNARTSIWFLPPDGDRHPADGIVAAVDQMFFEDDSEEEFELDHECFDTAKLLSDRFQCPLFAVHAYLVPNLLGGYEALLPVSDTGGVLRSGGPQRLDDTVRAHIARRHRDVVLDFIDEHGIPLDDVIVREGHVDQVLTATARAMNAGLIVMGSSSKTWWDRLLGRVHAEPTLANTPCDVLFVRPT